MQEKSNAMKLTRDLLFSFTDTDIINNNQHTFSPFQRTATRSWLAMVKYLCGGRAAESRDADDAVADERFEKLRLQGRGVGGIV